MKYQPDAAESFDVTKSIIATIITDTIVSGISRTIILTNVDTSVISELRTCGILWLISCLNV
ncbi:hypothetical protein, partial [Acinetobacter baumannii]|uniref:hypothetical protein n=1 Tax=Acinetobacter baumannii TaxID=470 RepID=UPI00332F0B97